MTPALPLYDGTNVQQILDVLSLSGAIDTGGRSLKLRVGTTTLTWPGANRYSNYITLNHGMGSLPVIALSTANDETGTGGVTAYVFIGATQLTVRGVTVDGTLPVNTATTPVSWIAIG